MKLVLFQETVSAEVKPGVLASQGGVVPIAQDVLHLSGESPQRLMQGIIDHFEELRPALERRLRDGRPLPLDSIRLRAPLPRPGKILCCIGNYWEHAQREPRPLNMFLKNSDAVIGPGETVVLPEFTEA